MSLLLTKVHSPTPANSESKAKAPTADAGTAGKPVITYTNVFTCPDHLPKHLFAESLQLSQQGIKRNQFNHHHDGDESTSRPSCHHDRVSPWKLLQNPPAAQCADCKAELGAARLSEELSKAKVAENEDTVSSQSRHDPRFAIRADVLLLFAFVHDCWDWPTWRVVRDIIVPATFVTRVCQFILFSRN